MTAQELKSVIAKNGGNDKLLAILFDGNYRVYFTKDNLFKEDMLDDSINTITYKEKVDDKYEYTVVKDLATIFGLIFIPDREQDNKYPFREIFR